MLQLSGTALDLKRLQIFSIFTLLLNNSSQNLLFAYTYNYQDVASDQTCRTK